MLKLLMMTNFFFAIISSRMSGQIGFAALSEQIGPPTNSIIAYQFQKKSVRWELLAEWGMQKV